MSLLTQFLLRLSFGLAAAMATVSPRQVASGYFRNHLYVVLGLSSLAALLSRVACKEAFGWAVTTALLSYAGSVFWLYETRGIGRIALVATAITALGGVLTISDVPVDLLNRQATAASAGALATALRYAHTATGGALLGATMAAMLLGHWYLNAPGMNLAPLRKLLVAMTIAVFTHMAVCAMGLGFEAASQSFSTQDWLFLLLRWSFGLAGVIALVGLAWRTLAIPNTQSATGILYVAVIVVFVGETMSLLLSAESLYPV